MDCRNGLHFRPSVLHHRVDRSLGRAGDDPLIPCRSLLPVLYLPKALLAPRDLRRGWQGVMKPIVSLLLLQQFASRCTPPAGTPACTPQEGTPFALLSSAVHVLLHFSGWNSPLHSSLQQFAACCTPRRELPLELLGKELVLALLSSAVHFLLHSSEGTPPCTPREGTPSCTPLFSSLHVLLHHCSKFCAPQHELLTKELPFVFMVQQFASVWCCTPQEGTPTCLAFSTAFPVFLHSSGRNSHLSGFFFSSSSLPTVHGKERNSHLSGFFFSVSSLPTLLRKELPFVWLFRQKFESSYSPREGKELPFVWLFGQQFQSSHSSKSYVLQPVLGKERLLVWLFLQQFESNSYSSKS